MIWNNLKRQIEHELNSLPRGKSQPRLNALDAIENLLTLKYPMYIKYPDKMFGGVSKEQFMANYPKKINGAEKGVIKLIYQKLNLEE